MPKTSMNTGFSEQDWLNKLERKSNSSRTRITAEMSLKTFDLFCKNQGVSRDELTNQYHNWFNPKPKLGEIVRPDIESICLSLDRFVDFMTKDQTIDGKLCKKKSFKTIHVYFGFVKSYLRICHKIKITVEDVKDYITFPTQRRDPRIPLELKQLKAIMTNAIASRRALYYLLVTSGMRVGEALSLTKENFHVDETPVRITLDAEITKTKQGRDCFITNEAFEKIKPILDAAKDNESLFATHEKIDFAVAYEDRNFGYLREKLGFTQKYPNSSRYVVNIHAMRAYFHTKASQKHGTEYANALDGHSGYLEQYYRLTPQRRAEMYQELEQDLLIESVPVESNKTKDKIITSLQEQMVQMQEEMKRMQKTPDSFEDSETA